MWEILNHLRETKKKSNRKPYYDELFSTLSTDNVDNLIIPYIELLKTHDVKKAIKSLNITWNNFELNEKIIESFTKFVDYLLEDNRYKDLFNQAYQRYNSDDKEVFDKVYNVTLWKLWEILSNIKAWTEKISKFYVIQVIKLLRWDAFVFKLGQWRIWFEKDYLYWEDAKKINKDKTDKPVYGLRMHVWDNASIYSLNQIFKEMWEFVETTDIWVKPYVWMSSRLLDTDLLRYRLKRKGRDSEKIDKFISERYGCLWKIELTEIKDSKDYNRAKKRTSNHTSDKGLVESYEKEWHKIKEWKCLINLVEYL